MKRKIVSLLCAMTLGAALLAGCGSSAAGSAAEEVKEETSGAAEEVKKEASKAAEEVKEESSEAAESKEEASKEEAVDDQAAADQVMERIEAIQIQKWTEDTPANCKAAKEAWDALTDAQKALVEEADYFDRDTGDAGADDPRCGDDIGENELLVVSFGTSFNDSRAMDIGGVEKALAEAYPDWSVRRAFTAQIILNHILARDGEQIDNMDQALQRAADNGVKNLVVQPTHLMHGAEYDELVEALEAYQDQFESVKVAEPLLGEVGSDATVINQDKEDVAVAVTAEAVKTAGYESLEAAAEDGTAFVFMGHGTSHTANVTYDQMQTQVNELGYKNVFIGTVEGEPEDTECSVVIGKVKEAGFTKVVLRPLMVVAGDHANNDMADPEDEESWISQFTADGSFEKIDCQIEGLGRIADVQALYVAHTGAALEEAGLEGIGAAASPEALQDGVYKVKFNTDSSMFHANEADEGKGVLTVEDGKMTLHVRLASDGIVNLFCGKAEDAQKEGAQLLDPMPEEVTYSDGTTEEVYAYDIPVPAVGEDFDVALIGKKGVWYDHVVSVSDPELQ